jgi:hypothetical protein
MVGLDMVRLLMNFFIGTGTAGVPTRVLATRPLLAPGTLAFLQSAR